MNKFKVALLQLIPSTESNENLDKGIKYCKLAKEMGADLALFPEMWNIGYNFPQGEMDIKEFSKNAIDSDSGFFKEFQNLAQKTGNGNRDYLSGKMERFTEEHGINN